MESAPKKFLVETEAEADNKAGEDPEIDENDDSVADPSETAPNEGVKEKTGSRGGKRNRKWSPCFLNGHNGCGGGYIPGNWFKIHGNYKIQGGRN